MANGYFVFTPLSGEKFVKIHRYDCKYAWRKPDHPERDKSWHQFRTYGEALGYAQNRLKKERSIKGSLNCRICLPGQ